MHNPNRQLLKVLSIGWLAFIGVGFGLRQALSGPTITVIIDRSYCPDAQWQQLTDEYTTLYQQHQQHRLTIDQVVYVSDLDVTTVDAPPFPDEVAGLSHFGQFNQANMQAVTNEFPNAEVLTCR
jgi:hypothetical protein